MAISTLSHNGFTRTSLQRRVCMPFQSCKECGMRAKYEYSTRADDDMRLTATSSGSAAGYTGKGSRVGWSKPFCSVTCYRAYEGAR